MPAGGHTGNVLNVAGKLARRASGQTGAVQSAYARAGATIYMGRRSAAGQSRGGKGSRLRGRKRGRSPAILPLSRSLARRLKAAAAGRLLPVPVAA